MKYSLALSALLLSVTFSHNFCMVIERSEEIQEKTIEGYQPGWGKFTVRLKYEEEPTVEFLHRSPYAHIEDNDVNGLATLAYQTSGFGTNINRIIYPDKIPHGDSPLGYAVRNNRVECTRILLILMAYKKRLRLS